MDRKTMDKLSITVMVILIIIGVITGVFAVLALLEATSTDPGTLLNYIAATGCIIIGIAFSLLGLLKDKEKTSSSIYDLIVGAVFTGFGIYLLIEFNGILSSAVSMLIPLIIACLGGSLLIKSTIHLIKKESNTKILASLIIGALLIIIGVLFACLSKGGNEKIINIIWLLIGLSIISFSVIRLVKMGKQNRVKTKANKNSEPIEAQPVEKEESK